MTLGSDEIHVLKVLSLDGAYLTRDVARRTIGSGRMHSACVRQWLLELERKGLVRRMDEEKPVCWLLTVAGATTLVGAA